MIRLARIIRENERNGAGVRDKEKERGWREEGREARRGKRDGKRMKDREEREGEERDRGRVDGC